MQNKTERVVYLLRDKSSGGYVRPHSHFTLGTLCQARIFNQAGYARNSRHYHEAIMEIVPFMLVELPLDFKSVKPHKISVDLTRVLESKL